MSDALSCDGPGCDEHASFPYLGWWQLAPVPPLLLGNAGHRLDFCSWECLGAFVFQQASDVAELQERINQMETEGDA